MTKLCRIKNTIQNLLACDHTQYHVQPSVKKKKKKQRNTKMLSAKWATDAHWMAWVTCNEE